MEISFVPSNENQKISNNGNNINNAISFNNYIYHNDKEYNNNNYKKEVIIEAIEEYNENEYEGDNENIVQKIRNEFNSFEQNYLYKSFSNLKTYNIKYIEEKKRINKSMIDII